MKDIYLVNYSVNGIKTIDKTVSLSVPVSANAPTGIIVNNIVKSSRIDTHCFFLNLTSTLSLNSSLSRIVSCPFLIFNYFLLNPEPADAFKMPAQTYEEIPFFDTTGIMVAAAVGIRVIQAIQREIFRACTVPAYTLISPANCC